MFKGCTNLEEVNTTLIISNEIEDIESMFEDCESLWEISFSNEFLTGEVKSLKNTFKNTDLSLLDLSYLRLYKLEDIENAFSGASIKGILKLGKYYSNNETRDNLLKEIALVTDPSTVVYSPRGSSINIIFQNIYRSIKSMDLMVNEIDIDYNINYREDEIYNLYSNFVHVGLGWEYDSINTYDLDSSVATFDSNLNFLDRVNYLKLTAYEGNITLSGDDLTGQGSGDDEEIRIFLDTLPSEVKIITVQINSFKGNPLKDVKSSYIRLSTQTDAIGTYSINQGGDKTGLLIGCFSRTDSNSWQFRPLNEAIDGSYVSESVPSIQAILQSIFVN